MAMRNKMTSFDEEDDLDLDALRLAALQTLKKSNAPPAQTQNSSGSFNNILGGPRMSAQGGLHVPQCRGRGRILPRRGRGRGFQNFHNGNNPGFYPNRPSGNSNLITIVPTVPEESDPASNKQNKGPCLSNSLSGNTSAISSTNNEEEKVPAKFRRLDDNSDSEESEDESNLKTDSDVESSDDDDEKCNDRNNDLTNPESENDVDSITLQVDKVEKEGDNSLEQLMRELEEEISETPKDKKPCASKEDKINVEKVSRLKKEKKEKRRKEKHPRQSALVDDASAVSSSDKVESHQVKCSDQSSTLKPQNPSRSPSPRLAQGSEAKSRSPKLREPASIKNSPARSWSPKRSYSPQQCPSPVVIHKQKSPTALVSASGRSPRPRSPLRPQSPVRTRSPLKSRSPRRSRSPQVTRSPRKSPLRSHTARSRSRSPYRSPRRSPLYPPLRGLSPGRPPVRRSRSKSPRMFQTRSRSPAHGTYVPRSRSPPVLVRRSNSPNHRLSPLRRSRSRSPGGRLYLSRRSRSISPRPFGSKRSPSPRMRRSPSPYSKKLSPKRRSISPRRRSMSPRKRSLSPRRRSISPRRRSISPRRRPSSPTRGRLSPHRSRSPIGTYSQRSHSPRRRSPYTDSYPLRRSPSPVSRRYSPQRRVVSPPRGYRSPSPVTRLVVRRRSPLSVNGPSRRSPPRHRAVSPLRHASPPRMARLVVSPGRNRDRQKQLSPLPSVSRSNHHSSPSRRQRSPLSFAGSHHHTKVLSPVRNKSPPSHSMKRSLSPSKGSSYPAVRGASRSISLSPSPDREPPSIVIEDRPRGRKSQPLIVNVSDAKRTRADLRSVLPRRKDSSKEIEVGSTVHPDELSKREKREKKRAKRERERQKREAHQDANFVMEARRRKFDSGRPVEVSAKKIRLRNEIIEDEEIREDVRDKEVNLEKEKERELKEASEVDESILDRELMGGVDLLWSDEEDQDEEEEEEEHLETASGSSNVQFKRTFNVESMAGSSGKENIPDGDSKKDDEPSSTTGSPLGNQLMEDDTECENDYENVSEPSDINDDQKSDHDVQESWPKTNKELKEYILSQAKGQVVSRFSKLSTKEPSHKSTSKELNVDLRAELSRRRAERLTKVNITPETLPGRLLQSALQGVGVKSRREKGHRRREPSPFEDDSERQDSDGRRVLVVRRATEQKEPAINITISKVESSKESSSSMASGKLPIHLRLGTGMKGDDSPKKVKLKRNITVGRKKQV